MHYVNKNAACVSSTPLFLREGRRGLISHMLRNDLRCAIGFVPFFEYTYGARAKEKELLVKKGRGWKCDAL